MVETSLLHIRLDAETKDDIQKLINLGFFSTEAELAREAIRYLITEYHG